MKASTTTASPTPPSDGKSGSPSFYPSLDWEKRKKAIIEQTLAAMDPGSEEYRMASLYPSMNPAIQRRLADEKSKAEAKNTPQQAASRPMDLADKSNRSNNTLSPTSPQPASPILSSVQQPPKPQPSESVSPPEPKQPPIDETPNDAAPEEPAQIELTAGTDSQSPNSQNVSDPSTWNSMPLLNINTSQPGYLETYGDDTTPPTGKYAPEHPQDWINWNNALKNLGVSGEELFAMRNTYLVEGAERVNPEATDDGSHAIAGITAPVVFQYLLSEQGKNVPIGIKLPKTVTFTHPDTKKTVTVDLTTRNPNNYAYEKGMKWTDADRTKASLAAASRLDGAIRFAIQQDIAPQLGNLTPTDRAVVMRHVIRDAFRRVENGYEGASQKLKDSMLMAAVIDTIYRDGPSKGTALIQEAILAGDTQGRYKREKLVDGILGTGTINAIEAVMKTEEGRRNFWEKYRELRNDAHKHNEEDRINRVIPPQYRTN
jgi:hypothetical protein